MPLTIAPVDPAEYLQPITELFVAQERPEFAAFAKRAYPGVAREGARSWIGRDETGRVCMHIARINRAFRFGDRTVVGGLLCNFMVAKEHRTFFPARALVKRLVEDTRREGGIDFLYGDPNEYAEPVLRSAGLAPVARLERFVLPVGEERWPTDVAVRLYNAARRARVLTRTAKVCVVPAAQHETAPLEGASPEGLLVPVRTDALYRRRLAGYPQPHDHWLHFSLDGRTVASALVRGPDAQSLAFIYAIAREPGTPLALVVPPLARALRRLGAHRGQLFALAGSPMARELLRAGFFNRGDAVSVLALPITDAGREAVAALPAWEVTSIEFDR